MVESAIKGIVKRRNPRACKRMCGMKMGFNISLSSFAWAAAIEVAMSNYGYNGCQYIKRAAIRYILYKYLMMRGDATSSISETK